MLLSRSLWLPTPRFPDEADTGVPETLTILMYCGRFRAMDGMLRKTRQSEPSYADLSFDMSSAWTISWRETPFFTHGSKCAPGSVLHIPRPHLSKYTAGVRDKAYAYVFRVLAEILTDPVCKGMLLDIGCPVRHRNVRYNTRVLCTYRHIYGIRAKQSLANSGLYREARHFSEWTKQRTLETYYLEQCTREVTGQTTCPIGDFILSTLDTAVTCETCEELFTPLNPSSYSGLK